MLETYPLTALEGSFLYSPTVEIEAQEVDRAKMVADLRKAPEDDLRDLEVGSCLFQVVVLASFFYVRTVHHQTQNPRSAILAGSEVVAD